MVAAYQLDPTGLESFAALRVEALHFALEASALANPQAFASFSQCEREAFSEDMGYHLDFLLTTLGTGDIEPFLAYLAWWSQVLRSRGLPTESLAQTLADFSHFFAQALGKGAIPILTALENGQIALQTGMPSPTYDQPCPTPWVESMVFCDAALQGQRLLATASFATALERAGSLSQASVHVIQPALYDVGRRWQTNQVSVAQEHMAAALSQTLMAQAMSRAAVAPDNGQRVLFACVPGNHHSIGLRMVADAFELDGWSAEYLGANTPTNALVAQVRSGRPQLVGLSVSLPQQLHSLRECITALQTSFGDEGPRIAVGGLVFNQFPQLARVLGVELLGTDACSAVTRLSTTICVEDVTPRDQDVGPIS